MNNKLILFIGLILILSTNVFADLTIGDVDVSTAILGTDRNYFNFPADISAQCGGTDLNVTLGCEYTVTYGGSVESWFEGTLDPLGKVCNVSGYTSAGTDDYNFNMRCFSNAGDVNGLGNNVWLDDTAPETIGTSTISSVTLTSTDAATTTGNGSGVKRIYYNLDNTSWTYSTTNPLVLSPGVGNHTIWFYAVDNLDNNEQTDNSGNYRVKPFTIQGISDCGTFVWIAGLLMLLMAYFGCMRLMNGQFDSKTVGLAVGVIIAIYIIYVFSSGVCVM